MVSAKLWPLLAGALLTLAGGAQAAAAPSIEGVWAQAKAHTLLVPADGQPVPFTAAGSKLYQAHKAAAVKGDLSFDPMAQCGSPGQPRLMLTAKPFAILVRPRLVTILYQWNRLFRQISVGEALVNPALGERWWAFGLKQGHATAQWQGDALVVHTDSFQQEGLLDALLPASDQLRLTERIRLRDPDTLEDRITIEDPANYTRPWDAVIAYARSSQSLPFPEDVCLDRLGAGAAKALP